MKSLTRTAYRAIAAFVAAAFVMIGLASPAFADGATVTIANQRTGIVYTDVATATKEATSGDTLVLGEGNYTLYNVSSTGTTRGKDLTFVGQGTDKPPIKPRGTSVHSYPILPTLAPSTTATTPLTAPAP